MSLLLRNEIGLDKETIKMVPITFMCRNLPKKNICKGQNYMTNYFLIM